MRNYKDGQMMFVPVVFSFVLLTLCSVSISSAENYIGIILDGYQEDCIVSRSGKVFGCKNNRRLYAGDKVIKKLDIKALKIKWAPYTTAKELDKTSLTVVFEPPKDKKGIVRTTRELLGFVRTGHTVSIGATRSILGEVIPQPGNNATLLQGQKSTFTWEGESGKFIVFKDSNNTEIFNRELKGEPFLQLSPEEIGMKPGNAYTWSIIGIKNEREFKIRLLSEDVAQQVTGDLQKIEKEEMENVDKLIQKTLYLQFLSDAYPHDIDLYWLSYLVLEATITDETNLKGDSKALLLDLRKNYLMHVRKE